MNLKKYFSKNTKLSKTTFAKTLGLSRQHLHKIIKDGFCSERLAFKIEKATEGEVKSEDLFKYISQKNFKALEERVALLEKNGIKLFETIKFLIEKKAYSKGVDQQEAFLKKPSIKKEKSLSDVLIGKE